jgi:hypothetical protein
MQGVMKRKQQSISHGVEGRGKWESLLRPWQARLLRGCAPEVDQDHDLQHAVKSHGFSPQAGSTADRRLL